jgi:ABC-type uncharacterized transport system permease subunit
MIWLFSAMLLLAVVCFAMVYAGLAPFVASLIGTAACICCGVICGLLQDLRDDRREP